MGTNPATVDDDRLDSPFLVGAFALTTAEFSGSRFSVATLIRSL